MNECLNFVEKNMYKNKYIEYAYKQIYIKCTLTYQYM